jgi:hypothetical protein
VIEDLAVKNMVKNRSLARAINAAGFGGLRRMIEYKACAVARSSSRIASKGPGSVREGITFLQGYQLVIDPDCEAMRNEARLYSWPVDRKTGQVIPGVNPIDANNHIIDSVRYSIEDLITNSPLSEGDGGVVMLPMWKLYRPDSPWHRRR